MLNLNTKNLANKLRDPFAKLIIIYVFWMLAWILAGSLFEVYFLSLGMSIHEIISTSIFWFCASLILIPIIKRIESKKFMLFGIFIAIVAIALLILVKDKEIAFVYRFLLSLTQVFFWVPFNIIFYEFRKNNNATLGAMYYSTGSILMLLLPGLGGYLAQNFGYQSLYLSALFCAVLTFVLAFLFLENKIYTYDAIASLKSIKGLKTLLFWKDLEQQ